MITVTSSQLERIFAYAHHAVPAECCGLLAGEGGGKVISIYPLRNVARNAEVAYEAAPEELFAAQRQMRERGEELLAIYHSHPQASDPKPSETDLRMAYYPHAVYLIVGLGADTPVMRGFKIDEPDGGWQPVEYAVTHE